MAIACVAPGYDLETCFLGFHWPYRQMCLSSTCLARRSCEWLIKAVMVYVTASTWITVVTPRRGSGRADSCWRTRRS